MDTHRDKAPINNSRYVEFQMNDTHREKAPSNKTSTITKSTNKGIWVVGTTNQLFIRGS